MIVLGSSLGCGVSLAQAPAVAVTPPTREFRLTGAVGERWNSNPAYQSDSLSPEGDYASDLRLDLSMLRKTERTDWSLRFAPFYTQYREMDQMDSANYTFDYEGKYSLSRRMRLLLAQHGEYGRNPLYVARVDTGASPVLTQETRRWASRPSASLETELSRTLALQVGGAADFTRFEDPALFDSQTYSGRTGLVKSLDRGQAVSAGYTYSRFLFSAPEQSDAESTAHDLQVGWSYSAAGRSSFALSAGASQVSQGSVHKTRPIGDASYRRTLKRVEMSAGFRQSLAADAGIADVSLLRDLYLGVAASVGRLASWELVGNYGWRTSALETANAQDLDYIGASLRGEVELYPRLSLAGEAYWREQTNSVTSGGGGTAAIPAGDVTVSWLFLGLLFKIH